MHCGTVGNRRTGRNGQPIDDFLDCICLAEFDLMAGIGKGSESDAFEDAEKTRILT